MQGHRDHHRLLRDGALLVQNGNGHERHFQVNDPLTIERTTLQAVFDTAVNSMDFGSGFLDDDDVVELRKVAVVLGVPTEVATPRPMMCKYEHGNAHVFGAVTNPGWCTRCGSWQKPPASLSGSVDR